MGSLLGLMEGEEVGEEVGDLFINKKSLMCEL